MHQITPLAAKKSLVLRVGVACPKLQAPRLCRRLVPQQILCASCHPPSANCRRYGSPGLSGRQVPQKGTEGAPSGSFWCSCFSTTEIAIFISPPLCPSEGGAPRRSWGYHRCGGRPVMTPKEQHHTSALTPHSWASLWCCRQRLQGRHRDPFICCAWKYGQQCGEVSCLHQNGRRCGCVHCTPLQLDQVCLGVPQHVCH